MQRPKMTFCQIVHNSTDGYPLNNTSSKMLLLFMSTYPVILIQKGVYLRTDKLRNVRSYN